MNIERSIAHLPTKEIINLVDQIKGLFSMGDKNERLVSTSLDHARKEASLKKPSGNLKKGLIIKNAKSKSKTNVQGF